MSNGPDFTPKCYLDPALMKEFMGEQASERKTPETEAAKAIGAIPFEQQEQILMSEIVPAAFARQLERQRDEARDALSRNFADYATTLKALKQERDEALKALAECREDAERYRWLRDFTNGGPISCGEITGHKEDDLRYELVDWLYDTQLDFAIDAAMKGTK